jgi:hypothetical protein
MGTPYIPFMVPLDSIDGRIVKNYWQLCSMLHKLGERAAFCPNNLSKCP